MMRNDMSCCTKDVPVAAANRSTFPGNARLSTHSQKDAAETCCLASEARLNVSHSPTDWLPGVRWPMPNRWSAGPRRMVVRHHHDASAAASVHITQNVGEPDFGVALYVSRSPDSDPDALRV